MADPPIHQFDPDMASDADFEEGTSQHLVPGNEGQMLDVRRTPVRIESLDESTGLFACRVLSFEDRGALWELPFEDFDNFQFPLGAPRADTDAHARIEAAIQRFDRPLIVTAEPAARAATTERLETLRAEAASWIGRRSVWAAAGGGLDPLSLDGDRRLRSDLRTWLEERDLWDLEDTFHPAIRQQPPLG